MLKSPLAIKETGYLILAGQTAPGKGITLRDRNFSIKYRKHIIVRYLRMRLSDGNKEKGSGPDGPWTITIRLFSTFVPELEE